MTLLVLIVAITMGALRLASRSVVAGERRMENQERFRMAATVMDAQIQSHLPLTQKKDEFRKYYFRGDDKTLRMATSYSIWGGRQGYVIVNYRVESGDRGKETLYAAEETPGSGGKRETELFTNASEIFFEYYHQEPDEETGRWLEQWSKENAVPEGIRLHVNFGAKKYLFLFPIRAKGAILPEPLTTAG